MLCCGCLTLSLPAHCILLNCRIVCLPAQGDACPPALPSPQAAEYISSCDCPAYLAHAERRLAEEVERVAAYLDASTEAKVVRVSGRRQRRLALSAADR